jgi:uncharacterized secreted protein with C-terminal beta-propeller domain
MAENKRALKHVINWRIRPETLDFIFAFKDKYDIKQPGPALDVLVEAIKEGRFVYDNGVCIQFNRDDIAYMKEIGMNPENPDVVKYFKRAMDNFE